MSKKSEIISSLLRETKPREIKPKEKKPLQSNNEIVIRLLLSQEKEDGDTYVKTQESHYVG